MRKVLVAREFDEFSRILAENEFEIINLPLIETRPLEDLSDFAAKLENLATYDGLFLTSRHAASVLIEKLGENNIEFGGKVYVLGGRSFEILRGANLNLIFDEEANTAREMLEKIPAEDLKNKRFLFIRGERSLRAVPELLSEFATVDEAVVYKTRAAAIEIDEKENIREALEKGEFAAACFFSPSGAESFLEQFDAAALHQTRIATIGNTTADFFERRKFKVDFVSSKASAEDFAVELVKFIKEN